VSITSDWFDQFVGRDHDPRMDRHHQWCWRHWAPCPELGANGIMASTMVMQKFIDRVLLPAGILPSQDAHYAVRANALMSEKGRLCCWLGDDEMYAIWGECPPAVREEMQHG